jgi:hypothetical protein
VAAVLAVHQIFLSMGYAHEAAGLGASLFALVPKAVSPILDPLLVDAGAWALSAWGTGDSVPSRPARRRREPGERRPTGHSRNSSDRTLRPVRQRRSGNQTGGVV